MKVLTLAAAAMLLFGTASPSFAWVPGPSNFEETVFDNYPSAEKALDIEQPREPWNAESASDNAEYRKKVIQYVSKSKNSSRRPKTIKNVSMSRSISPKKTWTRSSGNTTGGATRST